MKVTHNRSAQPFKAVLGFGHSDSVQRAMHGGNSVTLDIGWLTLCFGRDGNWNEFVAARTPGWHTFYLGIEPLPVTVEPVWQNGFKWVYAMKHHPEELFVGRKPPTVLQYAGITVVHAMDQRRRNFLTVAMPGGKLHLVFRNPGSRTTADWRPSKAPTAISTPVVQIPVVGATVLPRVSKVAVPVAPKLAAQSQLRSNWANTGDAEFDQFLNGLSA